VTRNKKLLKNSLTSAARDALVESKKNLISLAGSLADSIGQIIDAQTKRAVGPMQRRLDEMRAADTAAGNADTRQGLVAQLQGGKNEGETTAAFLARQADVRKQLADLDRKATEDALEQKIQGVNDEADARKEAVDKSVADLTAAFNAGLISAKTYTQKLAGILKANGASFKEAGDLLGFAFAEQFRAQVADISKQVVDIAKVLGMKGGATGGAGFGSDVTDPLDEIRQARHDRVSELKDHKSQLRDDQKALRDARKTADKKDDKRAEAAIKRDEAAIKRDEAFIKRLDAILRAARGIHIDQLSVAGAADEKALLKALGDLAAAASR
jgi:hypothetical protein